MSGGSWEYLCYANHRATNLWERAGDVRGMADRLVELGCEPEAHEFHALALRMDQMRVELESRWDALQDVMRSVEWLDSGDFGDETFREHIREHRGEKVPA